MNLEEITTVVSALAVVVALTGIYFQMRERARSRSFDFAWRIHQEFRTGTHIRQMRARAAEAFLNEEKISPAIPEVFDYFETIATLEDSRVIKTEIVVRLFGHWIIQWWLLGKDYIFKQRVNIQYPTMWNGFEKLAVKCMERQERRQGEEYLSFIKNPEVQKQFLVKEIKQADSSIK